MKKEVIRPKGLQWPGIWAPAVRTDDLVFVSACSGVQQSRPGANGIEDQVERAFSTIQQLLDAAGASFSQLIRTKLILSDFQWYEGANSVYAGIFVGDDRAARSTIHSRALGRGELVRVEAVGALAGKEHIVTSGMKGRRPGVASDVRSAGVIFMGGVVGNSTWDSDWQYGATVEEQTTQMLKNLRTRLEAAGLSTGNVVRILLLLNDQADAELVTTALHREWSGIPMPSLMVLEQPTMHRNFRELVEVYCFASEAPKTATYLDDVGSEPGGSSVVTSGDYVFVSGITGRDQQGQLAQDPEVQIRQAFENVETCLRVGGSNPEGAVRIFASFRDISDVAILDRIAPAYFSENTAPAMTAVEMSPASGEEAVKIECWAIAS